MADAEDAHGVIFGSKQDTVITKAETEGAGHIAAQRIHVAGASVAKRNQYSPPREHRPGLHRAIQSGTVASTCRGENPRTSVRTRRALPPSEYPCRAVQTGPARSESAGGLARLRVHRRA